MVLTGLDGEWVMNKGKILKYCAVCGWNLGMCFPEENPQPCRNPIHRSEAMASKYTKPIPRLRPEQERKVREALREKNRQSAERRKAEREEARQRYRARFKQCPFCSGRNLHVDLNGEKSDWVRCDDCNCTGPIADGEDEAIGKWNERKV